MLKIISGGQTGVDLAALDFALNHNFACGGFCPKGRVNEEGVIPIKYPLKETAGKEYIERTIQNIIHSDGTLIIKDKNEMGLGTQNTIQNCENKQKPYFIIHTEKYQLNTIKEFQKWMKNNEIKILNIAGNRESESPGIGNKTLVLLKQLFGL